MAWPTYFLHLRIATRLQLETHGDCLVIGKAYAIGCNDVHILLLDVVGIVDEPAEACAFVEFCYHCRENVLPL